VDRTNRGRLVLRQQNNIYGEQGKNNNDANNAE
jgi:hypothetical protein